MGRAGTEAIVEAINHGWLNLDGALNWHLTVNHYPPLPSSLIPFAKAVIEKANESIEYQDDLDYPKSQNLYDTQIDLPEGASWEGKTSMAVWQAIEWLHLDSFLGGEKT